MPKRIAIFLPALRGGGAEKAMLNLANELAGRGHQVDLLLVKKEGAYLNNVSPKVTLHDLKAGRILFSLPKLLSCLNKLQPDVLLSALTHINMVAAMVKLLGMRKMRVVISVRTHLSSSLMQHGYLRKQLDRFLIRWLYPLADSIVMVSHGVADDYKQLFPTHAKKVLVSYNPLIDTSRFPAADNPAPHPWLGAGHDVPVIVAIGRLTFIKDFVSLINATARLREKRPVKLIILGEGDLRSALEALITQLGLEDDVELPGFVSNPYPYLKACDLFVLSSRYEGIANVVAEALALAPRIVATDTPGCGPREILQAGRYGALVEPNNTAGLAQAMEAALQQLPQAVPDEAWNRFSIREGANSYLNILFPNEKIASA